MRPVITPCSKFFKHEDNHKEITNKNPFIDIFFLNVQCTCYLTNQDDKDNRLQVMVEGFLFAQKFDELGVDHGVHVLQEQGP